MHRSTATGVLHVEQHGRAPPKGCRRHERKGEGSGKLELNVHLERKGATSDGTQQEEVGRRRGSFPCLPYFECCTDE
ncbi:hypothetical protein E2562_014330 [Oryza meyeriana var. granulata]|uniref:Uncharacterized protein n=1 Tax=Oryza meyeriana var. granulata TaxID=110450 RepID=A0A6G1C642_9ORYZ|nr:hypothetical protein E2562_014330 [Oryza meyeriana var. granulata]